MPDDVEQEQEQEQTLEPDVRVSVTCWTTAKGAAQWKVRCTDQASEEVVDRVVGLALRGFAGVERGLAGKPPAFVGEEPKLA